MPEKTVVTMSTMHNFNFVHTEVGIGVHQGLVRLIVEATHRGRRVHFHSHWLFKRQPVANYKVATWWHRESYMTLCDKRDHKIGTDGTNPDDVGFGPAGNDF